MHLVRAHPRDTKSEAVAFDPLSVVLTVSVLKWHKKRCVCILSEVMRQVSPEERNAGVSSLVVQHDASELVWPLGAEG